MGPDEQFRRLGATITAKDILPRILWPEQAPKVWARTSKLLDCKEAVVGLLTGALVTDHAGASAYRLADLEAGGWDEDACRAAGVDPGLLPQVAAATDLAGRVTAAAADRTGLLAGTPVVVGPATCGQPGRGRGHRARRRPRQPGHGRLLRDHPRPAGRRPGPPARRPRPHGPQALHPLAGDRHRRRGPGLAAAAARPGRGRPGYDEIDRLVVERLDTDGAPLFAPWLSGERVPVFDDRAKAAFVGLDLSHDRGHLLQALMGGGRLPDALGAGVRGGVRGADRVAAGGRRRRHRQRLDPDHRRRAGAALACVSDPQDAAARGAAACALVGIGAEPDLSFARAAAQVERSFEPVEARRARHRRRYADHQALYRALAPIYHRTGS